MPKVDAFEEALDALETLVAKARGSTLGSREFLGAVGGLKAACRECLVEVERWGLYDRSSLEALDRAATEAVTACSRRIDTREAGVLVRALRSRATTTLQEPYRDSPWALVRQGYSRLSEPERALLDEAIRALLAGCQRACITLVWGLASSRLRDYIVRRLGWTQYNALCGQVSKSRDRRLQRFSRPFAANSHQELEYVPDAHLLAVAYQARDIDGGQFDQLCDMLNKRNNCAHPGAWAPAFHTCLSVLEEIEQLVILNRALT